MSIVWNPATHCVGPIFIIQKLTKPHHYKIKHDAKNQFPGVDPSQTFDPTFPKLSPTQRDISADALLNTVNNVSTVAVN